MFGDKAKLRIKVMNKMMKDKPSFAVQVEKKGMPGMAEEGSEDMPQEVMGDKGFISMPVSKEERDMILSMRKEKNGEMEEEMPEEMPSEDQYA